MDPVHIAKGDENAQEKVDNCLARLRQMMLDSDNAWEFDMQGTGTGTAVATLVIAPKNPPKPKAELKAETIVNGPDADTVPLADIPPFTIQVPPPAEEAQPADPPAEETKPAE